ncbi:MAG: 2-oxo acid dehydrogenase subunit E2 [Saprospiraceae bacterium]|nr:2-oxo acid dehydrogenase subunit E2 [Saprospiraceae bacterium]MDW8484288.1 2-oxo acid dehydrogenase subunit E2 [Saprospiraceae bacterium]
MEHFDPNNPWRIAAAAIYRKPTDSRIFGTIELDVTELEDFVQRKRREGLRITVMHPILLLIARGVRTEVPEMNCFVRRGRLVHRDRIHAAVSVLVEGGTQISSVIVHDADRLSLPELADALLKGVRDSRQGRQEKASSSKNLLLYIPWPFRSWLVRLVKWVTIDMGIALPALGLSPDAFGSFILSNIGSIGLDLGYAALLPLSNVSCVITMGNVESKPVVLNGQIVPRRILTINAVLDHRVVDAVHVGKMFRYLKSAVKGPDFEWMCTPLKSEA